MFAVKEVKNPFLEATGLDGDLDEVEKAIQLKVQRFAIEVMRPIAAKLDVMTPDQVIQDSSPIWEYFARFEALGVTRSVLTELGADRLKRIVPIVFEEFGYGDAGLAVAAFITKMPAAAARASGNPGLIEKFAGLRGCWVATQADRGSDTIDYEGFELAAGSRQAEGSLRVEVGSDGIVLNGRSSDWIACAPIAECALVHCPADYGEGTWRPNGSVFGAAVFVPLNQPGISRSPANSKLGQRTLPTGSIAFDNVRVPLDYLVAGRDEYHASFFSLLTYGAMDIGSIATGMARAAFDYALDYARKRSQGGVPLVEHQLTRWRLFEMWRKLEIARATVRRAAEYNFSKNGPHLLASAVAKVSATQAANEVISEAVQLFGANGLATQRPIEKLLRDVQVSLMEGGQNHVLAMQGANYLLRAYYGVNS
ncbi:acyl-CoA dehydrogenase family protein [Labrys portucalensis]|uniref:Acyl-CoA dehydrogenase family protein n=1 Tax=Labrys neptuniae TaxID=376174 RepID=A0ABV6ZQT1_9HYPH